MTENGEGNILERPVRISLGRITLDGDIGIPPGAGSIVLFARGCGSSRLQACRSMVRQYLIPKG